MIWDDLSDWTAYICALGTVWVEFLCVLMCWILDEATFSGDMSVVLLDSEVVIHQFPASPRLSKITVPLDLLVENILSKTMGLWGKITTVDGQNPHTPPRMMIIQLSIEFWPSQVVSRSSSINKIILFSLGFKLAPPRLSIGVVLGYAMSRSKWTEKPEPENVGLVIVREMHFFCMMIDRWIVIHPKNLR